MFSKEASKQLRQEFWTSFGKSFPKKWTLYNTKIKGLVFKFYFDTKHASVLLDIEDVSLERRIDLWEKLLSLKNIVLTDYIADAEFKEIHFLENGKEISRVVVNLENVCIHNKNTWQETMVFLNKNMQQLELFFEDYKEVLDIN